MSVPFSRSSGCRATAGASAGARTTCNSNILVSCVHQGPYKVVWFVFFVAFFYFLCSVYLTVGVSEALVPEMKVQSLGILCWTHSCDNVMLLRYI